jgi:hypothetical protein
MGWKTANNPKIRKTIHQNGLDVGELLSIGMIRDYAATLSVAVENWFWNLPSGEDIPKKFPLFVAQSSS